VKGSGGKGGSSQPTIPKEEGADKSSKADVGRESFVERVDKLMDQIKRLEDPEARKDLLDTYCVRYRDRAETLAKKARRLHQLADLFRDWARATDPVKVPYFGKGERTQEDLVRSGVAMCQDIQAEAKKSMAAMATGLIMERARRIEGLFNELRQDGKGGPNEDMKDSTNED
jgi:hypothetical protein